MTSVNVNVTASELMTSHQDKSRREVGTTALAVAYLRSIENKKQDALFRDPYAEYLSDVSSWRVLLDNHVESSRSEQVTRTSNHEDMMAIRTRKIDDEVMQWIDQDQGHQQIVVLGAGLDTRPWRLHLQPQYLNHHDINYDESISWFEIDFPEVFDYKLSILRQQSASTPFTYHNVNADLSHSTWIHTVASEYGYNPNLPTFWLLEGLTGYLTPEEATVLFQTIHSNTTSQSRLLATFVTPSYDSVRINLHRFKPSNPLQFVEDLGFRGKQDDFSVIPLEYGKPMHEEWKGYVLVDCYKP